MLRETDRKKRRAGSENVNDFEGEWSEKDQKWFEIYQQYFYFNNMQTKWQEYGLKYTSKIQTNGWKVIKETDTLIAEYVEWWGCERHQDDTGLLFRRNVCSAEKEMLKIKLQNDEILSIYSPNNVFNIIISGRMKLDEMYYAGNNSIKNCGLEYVKGKKKTPIVSHKLQRDDNIKPNIREIGSIP